MKIILSTTVASTFVGAILLTTNAFAADGEYTILNPAPADALRPLRSDIADRVVGPYTVDAGHFQLEADLVNYLTSSETTHYPFGTDEWTVDQFNWAPTVKIGLCERADFEAGFSYSTTKFEDTFTGPFGKSKFGYHTQGFGDVNTAVKINLWGNDGGTTALAVRPFLAIPTYEPSDVAGGIGLPFAVNLPEDFSIKIYQEVFFWEGRRFYTDYSANAAVHESLLDSKLDVFANFTSTVFTGSSRVWWLGYTGFGAGYNITSDFQAYAGLRFGVTSNAYDYNPYIGLTWRY